MKTVLALVISLDLALASALHATPDDDRFQKLANEYIEQTLQAHPEQATELGDHRFDDRLTDYSPETRAKELAKAREFRDKLNSFGPDAKLSPTNSVDLRILKDNVDYEIFDLEELKGPDWNPLTYNQSLANSLYLLVARDFDTPEKRIPNLRKRMEAIPGVIEQAKANLKHSPKVHTETAIDQMKGAVGFVREGLNPLLDRAPEMKKEIAPLQEKTALALEEYAKWLKEDLLPRSDGDFRLGLDKFRKKLRFALASDLSVEELLKRAKADLAATQAAIYETALPLHKKYFPNADAATLSDKKKVTTAVLDKLAEEHPDDNTIVAAAEKAVVETTDFVKKKNLVRVPDKPLKVIVMPEFKRGQGIAYCDSPGPLEKTGETFFACEPTPKDWTKERKESFYREYNNFMVKDLTVHEAMPGHFLQLAHSNEFRAPTLCAPFSRAGLSSKAGRFIRSK
jgi:uncharacterized protein (DUF885 family)